MNRGTFCAESVLLATAEAKGIQSGLIPKIATGLCSGVARTCGVCGAVSGAILSLRLLTGQSSPDESVEENYAAVQKLLSAFEDKFGSTNCPGLIACDIGARKGMETFKANNLDEQCKQYTEEATRLVMQLLEQLLE